MASGFCLKHYKAWRKYGDPTKRFREKKGEAKKGYVSTTVGGQAILQHRHVMEQTLGRSLLPHESVHHINGVKNDNRPENLELWSKSQPPGQRVIDKLQWAEEILALYGALHPVEGK